MMNVKYDSEQICKRQCHCKFELSHNRVIDEEYPRELSEMTFALHISEIDIN